MKFFDTALAIKNYDKMSDNGISKLNSKELATRIASDALAYIFAQARGEVGKKIAEVGRRWGANIPTESESQFLNELEVLFPAPAAWPGVEVVIPPVAPGVTNSAAAVTTNTKAAGRKKGDTTKAKATATKKAADFRPLVVPSGHSVPTCPAIMKSGDKEGQPCGRECKRITDDHDVSNEDCANLTCEGHMFCGSHIVKGAESSGGASARLKTSANPEEKPVTFTAEGKETRIDASAVGAVTGEESKAAAGRSINRLVDKMKARRAAEAKKAEQEAPTEPEEDAE
jgi:hypothetical protein